MNKNLTAALFALTSSLILSTTAIAEPFNRGSGFNDATSNLASSISTPSARNTQEIRRSGKTVTSGFNMRSIVESENYSNRSNPAARKPVSSKITGAGFGFNDRS